VRYGRKKGPAPDFVDRKTPVMALVERGGEVRALPPEQVTGANLKDAIREHVAQSARIITDERLGYRGIGAEFEGRHETVNHSAGEYARGDVTTNTVEGFFSLLKRGVVETFHHVRRKHLHRYVGEFAFRYNFRKTDDGTRTIAAIRAGIGKRLTYQGHIATLSLKDCSSSGYDALATCDIDRVMQSITILCLSPPFAPTGRSGPSELRLGGFFSLKGAP